MSLMAFYPLLWVLCIGLAAFALIMLDIYTDDLKVFFTIRHMKLRDKLHFAMSQSPKRGMA